MWMKEGVCTLFLFIWTNVLVWKEFKLINKDIIDAFKIIAKDKDIETVNLSYIIEELFINLMHKKYGEENNNFSIIVNMDKGEIEIYQEKIIVDFVKANNFLVELVHTGHASKKQGF